ncbi:hypothetical protein DMJ13_18325 [halophilic archaeon]|nr:hypothetical protein DMJ13_18325 [halophilic archaeon]
MSEFSLKSQAKFVLGKKALKAGYKRYGIPGAVATGSAAALGYVFVKRALKSSTERQNVASAIDIQALQSQISANGLDTITDRETLDAVINEEEVNTEIEIADVQTEAAEETDELDTNPPEGNEGGSQQSAAAGSDASASTGSITEETNDSPSAAEPSEAAGPSENEDTVHPETDDQDETKS